jgi:RNA polymerase sigma-70 factor, ECF subfamily
MGCEGERDQVIFRAGRLWESETSTAEDVGLASRALTGDEEAWMTIVKQHWTSVWRLSMVIVRERQGAEDVAMETFSALRRKLATYRGEGPLGTWIQTICRRLALDELRRRTRRARETSIEAPGVERMVARSGEDDWIGRLDLEKALASLGEKEREAILLQAAGYSSTDAAEMLGVAPTTIRSRQAKAREKLLPWLAEYRRKAR